MDNPVTLFFLVACALLAGGIMVAFCLKQFNFAVILIVASPLFSTVFSPNSPNPDPNPGIGSYLRIGLLTIMGSVGLFKFIKSKIPLSEKVNSAFIILGLFILLAVISSSYSIDPYYSFIRSTSFVAFLKILGPISKIFIKFAFDKRLFLNLTYPCLKRKLLGTKNPIIPLLHSIAFNKKEQKISL